MRGRASIFVDSSYSLTHTIGFCVTVDVGCLKKKNRKKIPHHACREISQRLIKAHYIIKVSNTWRFSKKEHLFQVQFD